MPPVMPRPPAPVHLRSAGNGESFELATLNNAQHALRRQSSDSTLVAPSVDSNSTVSSQESWQSGPALEAGNRPVVAANIPAENNNSERRSWRAPAAVAGMIATVAAVGTLTTPGILSSVKNKRP